MTFRKPLQLKRGLMARLQALGLAPGEPALVLDDPAKPKLLVGDKNGNPVEVSGGGGAMLYGLTDPTTADGKDGDSFVNRATRTLFGPKVAGAWPAGIAMGGGGIETYTLATLPSGAAEGTAAYVSDAIGWVSELYKCVSGQPSTEWTVSPPHAMEGCYPYRISWDGCYRYETGTLRNTAPSSSGSLGAGWGVRKSTIGTSGVGVGPDFGALGTVTEEQSTGNHPIVYENASWSSIGGSTYILSIVWKPGTRRRVRISLGGEAFSGELLQFNGITGEVTAMSGLAGGAVPLANGCYRLWIKATARQSIQSLPLWVWPEDDTGNPTYLGGAGIAFYAGYLDIKIATALTYWIGPCGGSGLSKQVTLGADKSIQWNPSENDGVVAAWGRQGTLALRRGGKWVDAAHGFDLYKW